jgi:hypothetical protein
MITIINPKQLERATVRIVCGQERGSGFFIREDLVMTARHVVLDFIDEKKPIEIEVLNTEGKDISRFAGELVGEDFNLDVAVVKLQDHPPEDHSLPLYAYKVRYDEAWETFGYSAAQLSVGSRYYGKVIKTNSRQVFDIEIGSDDVKKGHDHSGLSGSAMVVNGKVVGVIISQLLNDQLGVISITKLKYFLNNLDIQINEPRSFDEIPESLVEEIKKAISNDATLQDLEEMLSEGGGRFFLLYGTPGSGKTILAASFQPNPEAIEIVGRYFVRLPKDSRPLSVRISNESLLQWFEFTISNKLSGAPPPKSDLNMNQRIERLSGWLQALNQHYLKIQRTGIVIIDGLDDVRKDKQPSIDDFLSIIPENLPSNIAVLLSCTTAEILPAWIKSRLKKEQMIRVGSLDQRQCEAFVATELRKKGIEFTFLQIKRVAERSEGHPLYLHYLVGYLTETDAHEDIDKWLDNIPLIGGDIRAYYEEVWDTSIANDSDKVCIALTVSQLRQPVNQETIMQMLSVAVRQSFLSKFQGLKRLFKSDDDIEVDHSSFATFLEEKGVLMIKDVHDNIFSYCQNHAETTYAITNCLFHQLKSSDPKPAIKKCNQLWADKCALISVEPGLIISDIKQVETLCIDQGEVVDLLRIKLLLQRIRFRYNQILAENAHLLADALISLEKPKDAIKYLLRDSFLLIRNDEALYFLQKFYEAGAFNEANVLMDAIRTKCNAAYDNISESHSIHYNTFILHLNSITLSTNKDFKGAVEEFHHHMRVLKKLGEYDAGGEEQKHGISKLREYLSTWHAAYVIWRYDLYASPEKTSKMMQLTMDQQWARMYSMVLIQHKQFQDDADIAETARPKYSQLLHDIEDLIQNYGFEETDAGILTQALLTESKRSDIVAPIVLKYLKDINLPDSIREKNGVDPAFDKITAICDHELYRGYIDEKDEYPVVPKRGKNNCDYYLISLLRLAGFILGKAYRSKANDSPDDIMAIETRIDTLINQMDFTLAERISWDRSYALPEAVLPEVFTRILRFVIEFKKDKVQSIIDRIITKSTDQLGLYTEGFGKCLYSLADMISRYEDQKESSYKLIKALDSQIDMAIQNRLERAPALLYIVRLYNRIGNREKAWQAYQRMLDTSMGPSWYKEDQVTLMNTGLGLKNIGETSLHYFRDFAECLKFASGEMTFQRFVKYEKEEFVGSLAQCGYVDKAIEYFKFEILPDPSNVIDNVESSKVDAPRKGEGYVLGAYEINEAHGIIELISGTDADPIVLWSLAEIFVANDDTGRHLSSFAEIQGKLLNKLHSSSSPFLQEIQSMLSELVLSEKMTAYREKYLASLRTALCEDDFNILQGNLLKQGIMYGLLDADKEEKVIGKESKVQDEDFDDFSLFGAGKLSNLKKIPEINARALTELNLDNKERAREILVEGLEMLYQGKSDIWMGKSLSHDVGQLFDILCGICTPELFVQTLKNFIVNHYTNDWRVANSLIKMIAGKLDAKKVELILEAIKEHIHLMIRPDEKAFQRYSWIEKPSSVVIDQNNELSKLMIWLLNHPYDTTKKRAAKSIQKLAKLDPTKIIPLLIREALDQKPIVSSELSAFVLTKIARDAPHSVWETIKGNFTLQAEIVSIKHFMIRQYFMETLMLLDGIADTELRELHRSLADTIPKSIILQGKITLNERYLIPVKRIVDALNELLILTELFREELIRMISQNCAPLSMLDQVRADMYVRRSFFDEDVQIGRYQYLLHHAINYCVTPRVDVNNLEEVEDILRLPFTYEA